MNGLLFVIAALLACVLAASILKQRRVAAAEREVEAERHTPEQRAHHERSMRRRAEVRRAHAERSSKSDFDSDPA